MKRQTILHGIIIIALITILFILSITVINKDQGKYFPTTYPDSVAQLFFPGFISTGLAELNSLYTPDGKEFLYCIDIGAMNFKLLFVKIEGNYWNEPEIASFTKKYTGVDAFYENNGNRIYYCSNRPINEGAELKDWDIWYVDRTMNDWSEPKNIGSPINSEADEFYPTMAENGNLYFQSVRKDTKGSRDIYVSKYINGKYLEPENLGDSINSKGFEGDCFIAPDESYIIFSAVNRPNGFGIGDLYISYKINDSIWTKAKNLGPNINSRYHENCPIVSNDGKYLFFTSRKINEEFLNDSINFSIIKEINNQPQNGKGDIYWVDAKVIQDLRPNKNNE
jgi:WD40-like Beta Propeller Repeat